MKNLDNLTIGVCYYPEHWNKSFWEKDLIEMKKCGISVVRVAEFAWSFFEPSENVFTFDLFDEFLEVAKKENMDVIFSTPTATPPAWICSNYPDILNETSEKLKYTHGARRHYNYNSKTYRFFSKRICEKLAEHYGKNETIVGWQIDNEFNCEVNVFYSQADTIAFRNYLQDKYKTIENLNTVWGTAFWNQTYNNFDQIDVQGLYPSDGINPHCALDYKRFISHSCVEFFSMQEKIIRKLVDPKCFITTNGSFGHLDYNHMKENGLDFLSYDSYPNFINELSYKTSYPDLLDRKWSMNLAATRSVSNPFCVMEQQASINGWINRIPCPSPKPGQIRLWTMQSIAHGANFVSYFRWRTAPYGTEMYWHGIKDYANNETRYQKEIIETIKDVNIIKEVASAKTTAKVAVLHNYDNEWDGERDVWYGEMAKYSEQAIFDAANKSHTPIDLLIIDDKTRLQTLNKYSLIIYPHPAILTEKIVEKLEEYVKQGGKLVFGARTGYKDKNGQCVRVSLPGLATNLTGINVNDYTIIGKNEKNDRLMSDNKYFTACNFIDILEPLNNNVEVLLTYADDYFKGQCALSKNKYFDGEVYYLGTGFTFELANFILDITNEKSPFENSIKLDSNCELIVRENDANKYLFVLNYSSKDIDYIVKADSILEIIENKILKDVNTIEPYGVRIFKI